MEKRYNEQMDTEEREAQYASINGIATYLGIDKQTVRNWMSKAEFPYHVVGAGARPNFRFKYSEVDTWMRENKVQ